MSHFYQNNPEYERPITLADYRIPSQRDEQEEKVPEEPKRKRVAPSKTSKPQPDSEEERRPKKRAGKPALAKKAGKARQARKRRPNKPREVPQRVQPTRNTRQAPSHGIPRVDSEDEDLDQDEEASRKAAMESELMNYIPPERQQPSRSVRRTSGYSYDALMEQGAQDSSRATHAAAPSHGTDLPSTANDERPSRLRRKPARSAARAASKVAEVDTNNASSKSNSEPEAVAPPIPQVPRNRRPPDQLERKFSCPKDGCDKVYAYLSSLNTHMSSHDHGEKFSATSYRTYITNRDNGTAAGGVEEEDDEDAPLANGRTKIIRLKLSSKKAAEEEEDAEEGETSSDDDDEDAPLATQRSRTIQPKLPSKKAVEEEEDAEEGETSSDEDDEDASLANRRSRTTRPNLPSKKAAEEAESSSDNDEIAQGIPLLFPNLGRSSARTSASSWACSNASSSRRSSARSRYQVLSSDDETEALMEGFGDRRGTATRDALIDLFEEDREDDEATIVHEDDQATIVDEDDQATILAEDDQATIVIEDDQATIADEDGQATIVDEDDQATILDEDDYEEYVSPDRSTVDDGEEDDDFLDEEEGSSGSDSSDEDEDEEYAY